MQNLFLDGFWLIAAFAVVYLVGVFTSQWAKDKIKGVPSSLRTALKTTEASALAEINKVRDKAIADVASLLNKGKQAVAAEVAPAPAPAPVVPAAPAPPVTQ